MTTPTSVKHDDHSVHWHICCHLAKERNVVFYYEGYFSQPIIVAVSDAVKMRIEHAGAENRTRRRLFSSFIEMTQNIIHYSVDAYKKIDAPDFNNEVRHGSICIATESGRFFLHCANPVRADIARQLRRKLERLHTLTTDQIKDEYRQTLRTESMQNSKGAGLGLLTVARDASEPLEFEFIPIQGSENVLFYLKATI